MHSAAIRSDDTAPEGAEPAVPHVFQAVDGVRIHRLSRGHAVIRPQDFSLSDAVAVVIGAREPPAEIALPEGAVLEQARADFPVAARPWRAVHLEGGAR